MLRLSSLMSNVIPVLSILLVTWKCPGIHAAPRKWTQELDNRLLRYFFQTLPSNKDQESRMLYLWHQKYPLYKGCTNRELQKHALELVEKNDKKWHDEKPDEEKDVLKERLLHILMDIDTSQPDGEKNIFEELLQRYPEYNQEPLLVQSVIHKWYKLEAPRCRESHCEMILTPEEKALLWYTTRKMKTGDGTIRDRIVARWSQLYPNQNFKTAILMMKLRKLRQEKYEPNPEELAGAKRKYDQVFSHEDHRFEEHSDSDIEPIWTSRWPPERKANLLYIYKQNKDSPHGDFYRNMQIRWTQIYGDRYPMDGEALVRQARRLLRSSFIPTPELMAEAKQTYDNLPPLGCNKGVWNKMNPGKERGLHIEITRQFCEQRHQKDLIAMPTLHAEHRKQKQHMLNAGHHTAYSDRALQKHKDTRKGKEPINLDLNQPYQGFDLNEPYYDYEHGSSSTHSRIP